MSSSFIESNGYNNSLYAQISDESYIKMEQDFKDEIEFNNLLGSQKVPDLNDTLDEINFILELGNKLNLEGNLGTPDCKREVSASSSTNRINHSLNTVQSSENLEESSSILNNSEGISYFIEESEILELQKFKKFPTEFNNTTKFEDCSETAYFADKSEDQPNETILIEDSFILDDTQHETSYNSYLSEHGSEGEQSSSTIEDDNCCEESEQQHEEQDDISEIDLTDDDSVIEILDESFL